MITNLKERTAPPPGGPCATFAVRPLMLRPRLLLLLVVLIVLVATGCTTTSSDQPEDANTTMPLMPESLQEAPPPGIRLLLDSEQARYLSSSLVQAAGSAQATAEAAETDSAIIESAETEEPDEETAGVAAGSDSEVTDVIETDQIEEVTEAIEDAEQTSVSEQPTDETENDSDGAALSLDDLVQDALQSETDSAEGESDDSLARLAESPTVTVTSQTVNIRSGPSVEFPAVTYAILGDTFEAVGRSAETDWWRICCIQGPGDGADEATQRAWISHVVVTANQAAQDLPLLQPLFPEDLQANWTVDYLCGSDRCEVQECTATITADVLSNDDQRWLEVDREVQWSDGCGENSSWMHQIDRLDGTERYENASDLFLYNFWTGRTPDSVNSLFSLDEDQQVKTVCSDEQEVELEEGNGWTTIYNGMTCHDTRTGMLVSMKYTKRWLFTGEYEEEQYERAYFGDYEVYEVRLDNTNVELAWVISPAPEAEAAGEISSSD